MKMSAGLALRIVDFDDCDVPILLSKALRTLHCPELSLRVKKIKKLFSFVYICLLKSLSLYESTQLICNCQAVL